jgi:ribonuclease PH
MQNCYTPRRPPPPKQANGAAPAVKLLQHRADGRKANELRRVYLELGVVSQAAGSAYVELDHTKVVCAVYGPHAQAGPEGTFSEGGQLRCDFKIAPFATSSRCVLAQIA